ncbi:TrmB family transcriptional regulator [Methanoplanus endosymbiosus]|uniref:TrmB family transcriptional regulator n=1 Tax=Methanoplanus endosymbiosus TaxID=33865 RepID=A0A9E7PSR9_9EURY|nr:helix-turn-helix domain-containing protein [Methanoplanus endosymbiosus]UUX93097.1 TrmB family transcriptional regulator [Methanoplanus endosymbiosus]
MKNKVIETLKTLGLTEYESKAYVSIVGLGISSAREIHENSGVPLGRIYSVLKSLADKGFIDVQEGNPAFYSSSDPSMILNSFRMGINKDIDDSIKYLGDLHFDTKPISPFWTIRSEWSIKNRLKSLILNANKEIIFIVEDFNTFRWAQKDVVKAKKRLNIEIYADNKSDFEGTGLRVSEYSESWRKFTREFDLKLEEIGDRRPGFSGQAMKDKLVMIIDESTAFAIYSTEDEVFGTVIMMPALVYMLKVNIKFLEDDVT